jgi:HEAT repeat protein
MPLLQFCSTCWAENLMEAPICTRCGTPLSETAPIYYEQKLMRALHHPLPETREMAATLLGYRRDMQALPILMSRLFEETDIAVLCAISKTLGQLGDCQAAAALSRRLAQPDALVVALTLVEALASLAQTGCWEALDVLKAPPSVPERVAKEIDMLLKTLNRLYY